MNFPIKHGDFPSFFVCLPEGTWTARTGHQTWQWCLSPHRNGEGVSIGMCDFLEGRLTLLTLLSTLRWPNSGTAPTSGFIQFGKCQFHGAKKPDVESVDPPFRNDQRKSVVNTGSSRK